MTAPSSEIKVKTEPVSDPHTLSFPEKVELFDTGNNDNLELAEPAASSSLPEPQLAKVEPVNDDPMPEDLDTIDYRNSRIVKMWQDIFIARQNEPMELTACGGAGAVAGALL